MEGEVQVSQTEVVPAPPSEAETPQEQNQESAPKAKPEGWDEVEIPAELQPRFNRIYGNMKQYESKFKNSDKELKEVRQINMQLIDAMAKLEEQQGKIVNHLQTADFQDAETQINNQIKEAWGRGDIESVNTLNAKLIDIKVQKTISDKLPKPQSVVEQPKNNGYINGKKINAIDAVDAALQKGTMSSEEGTVWRSWLSETDNNGNLRRPWANVDDARGSPASIVAAAVFHPENPTFKNKSLAEKLKEVDRQMGVQTQMISGSNVLPSGNLTKGPKTNNVKLSDYQERLAIRTKFGGPKAKSDADHVEAFRRAVIKSQSKGAAR